MAYEEAYRWSNLGRAMAIVFVLWLICYLISGRCSASGSARRHAAMRADADAARALRSCSGARLDAAFAFFVLFPILWICMMSLKSLRRHHRVPATLPVPPTLNNYAEVLFGSRPSAGEPVAEPAALPDELGDHLRRRGAALDRARHPSRLCAGAPPHRVDPQPPVHLPVVPLRTGALDHPAALSDLQARPGSTTPMPA